jgi:hypothetical protein
MYLKIALAAFVAAAAGTASAATYDYTGSQTNPGGPALSCEALGILNDSCSVTFNADGLGVNGRPDTSPGLIDGFPLFSSERLTLDFGIDTIWNSITLGRWDRDDDLRLIFDGGEATYGPGESNGTITLGGIVSRFLTITAYGQLGQDGLCFFCGDPELKYDKFTVASVDVSEIAPVPLPAAGLLLAGALGGLAAMRRRKSA